MNKRNIGEDKKYVGEKYIKNLHYTTVDEAQRRQVRFPVKEFPKPQMKQPKAEVEVAAQ
jgi:hypothetical protein